jgi:spermine synthase
VTCFNITQSRHYRPVLRENFQFEILKKLNFVCNCLCLSLKMAANSVLLDFSIEPSRISDESSREDMVKVIKENLEKYFGNLKLIYDMLIDDGYMCILNDNSSTIFSIRFFNAGIITLNIEYWKGESDSQRISFEVKNHFSFYSKKSFPITFH